MKTKKQKTVKPALVIPAAIQQQANKLVASLIHVEAASQGEITTAWRDVVKFAVKNHKTEGIMEAVKHGFEKIGLKDAVLNNKVSEVRTCCKAFEAKPEKAATAFQEKSKALILDAMRKLVPQDDSKRGPKVQPMNVRAERLAQHTVLKVQNDEKVSLPAKEKLCLLLVATVARLSVLGVTPPVIRTLADRGIETAKETAKA